MTYITPLAYWNQICLR